MPNAPSKHKSRLVFIALVLLFIVASFLIKKAGVSQNEGLVFAEYGVKTIKPDSTYIMPLSAKNPYKYQGFYYKKTTIKYPQYETVYTEQIAKFKKQNNLYQPYVVFFDKKNQNLLLKDDNYRNGVFSFDLWVLNIENNKSEKLQGKFSDSEYGTLLDWNPEKREIYLAQIKDVSSVSYVVRFTKINQDTGKITKTIKPQQELSLDPFYVDSETHKAIVGQFVVDFNEMTVSKITVPQSDYFTVFSYQFVKSRLILQTNNGELIVFNAIDNSFSSKLKLDKIESYYEYEDVSADFHYLLVNYSVRYKQGWKDGANASSCYVLVDLDTMFQKSRFCSADLGKEWERKSFAGWAGIN